MEPSDRFGSGRTHDFDWLSGTNVGNTYHNFAELINNSGFDRCGVFFTMDGSWKTERCGVSRHFVCQRNAGK